jgi:hypothetical protein
VCSSRRGYHRIIFGELDILQKGQNVLLKWEEEKTWKLA